MRGASMSGAAESGEKTAVCTQCHDKREILEAGIAPNRLAVGSAQTGVFIYFVDVERPILGRKWGYWKDIVNFYDPITCYLRISSGKNKIKSAYFTNFRLRMPLFSEYYEKFKNLYFLD